jgi:MarR-like DNA-binding transcriptional regulator SgrR of sgrS sRNA
LLTSEEVQAYLLHLIVERKLAYASVNQASCSCQFLFCTVLKRPLERFDIHMAKVTQTIFHTCVGNISGLVATTSPVTVYPHLRGEVWNIRQGRPRRPRYPSPP